MNWFIRIHTRSEDSSDSDSDSNSASVASVASVNKVLMIILCIDVTLNASSYQLASLVSL